MEFKIKNKKSVMFIIAFGILLYWGLNHIEKLWGVAAALLNAMFPFLLGAAIAFVVNVPMKIIEGKLTSVWKRGKGSLRIVSIFLSYMIVFMILAFVMMTVIPELMNTLMQLNAGIPQFIDSVNRWATGLTADYPEIADYLKNIEINWVGISQKALEILQNGVPNVWDSTVGVASTMIGGVTKTAFGFIFSLYILGQKEKLGIQFRKIVYAYLPANAVSYILKVAKISNRTFSGFILGQSTEAVIFGVLCFFTMTIFRFPYAVSISVMIGFSTLIPVVGAFIGTVLGAILIMVTNPVQALWFIALIIVIQQIDGNLIYPRIVGNSVGLPGMWVLFAVTVGGTLFGIAGMLICVPLFSVIYAMFRESVYKNLHKKRISEREILG